MRVVSKNDTGAAARGSGEAEMARNEEQKTEGEAVVVEAADGPLLDLTDAAV